MIGDVDQHANGPKDKHKGQLITALITKLNSTFSTTRLDKKKIYSQRLLSVNIQSVGDSEFACNKTKS